jgi:predicted nucleotidyltransferase
METRTIDIQQLTEIIRDKFPDIAFAYLFGSSQEGVVKQGSDLDIAVYYKGDDIFIRFRLEEQLEQVIGNGIYIDVVELQKIDNTVLAFEALSGKQLFVRDECIDEYADFYVRICRKYEDEMYWMKKQLKYRGYEVQWDN